MKQPFLNFSNVFFVVAVTVLTSCSNAPEKAESDVVLSTFSIDSVKASIAASNKMFGESFATGDSAKFVDRYTSDACIYVTNSPKMCGQQSINAFFNGAYAMGMRNVKLTTEEISGSKEAVVETGTYDLLIDKGVSIDKGKYIVIWKEEKGQWKMHRDIWNTDMPAAPAKK